jgi:hypothetical protein
MAMAHLNGDFVFDEQVEQGELRNYDALVMPKCEVITASMLREIEAFQQRGGVIIADQYLGPKLDNVISFDFDFTYRPKVNADAIHDGVMYAEWNDQLKPDTAALKEAKGVPADEDQKIMEAYARELQTGLAGKVDPEVKLDSPQALVNVLEHHGVKYLAIINDKRKFGERLGQYKAILDELVPHTVTVSIPAGNAAPTPYDLLEQKSLPTRQVGDRLEFAVDLDPLGGKLIALSPAKLEQLSITGSSVIPRGQSADVTIDLTDAEGRNVRGLQPLQINVTNAGGHDTEFSGYVCAEDGHLQWRLSPGINETPGKWTIEVRDLTAGLIAEASVEVR